METMPIVYWPLLIAGGYLLGSIPFAQVLASFHRVDLRVVGTGNVGAGNLRLQTNWMWGLAAGLLDAAKGFAPVFVALEVMAVGPGAATIAGIAAVVGHNWSVFMRGRSGRGLATSAGLLLALDPFLLVWVGGWAAVGIKFGGGFGGFMGWGLLPVVSAMMGRPSTQTYALLALSALLLLRRAQGNREQERGLRTAMQRMVYDTDRAPESSDTQETVDKPLTP